MGSVAGTIGGFVSWFSLSLKSAFALVGIGAFATLINPTIAEWQIKLIGVGFCVFFTVLNLTSVKFTGKIQVFLVITLKEFFETVAGNLAERLDMDAEHLIDSFIAREEESSTVLRPGLAIPHITIDGERKFELVIARCEAGIEFAEDMSSVYAVFMLIGSLDERNFHLRALSAVAQIVQDPDFDRDWLRAKSIQELRDIVLLAKRHR